MATLDPRPRFVGADFRGLGFSEGEVIVVTGAGSGIGRATAIAAAGTGLTVAAWDLDGESAAATVTQLEGSGGRGCAITVDVGDAIAVKAAWQQTLSLGPCRYLVNNAGPASGSSLSFEEALRIAVGGVERVTTGWLERCPDDASSLVNMASIAGNVFGGGVQSSYVAAKGALAALTREYAYSFQGRPRVNALAPGLILTPRTLPYLDKPEFSGKVNRIPVGRFGDPEEVAAAAMFLLSPAAGYINGVLLPVDGGLAISG